VVLDKIELIPRIYDAVGNPEEWTSVFDDVTQSLGIRGANIFSGDSVEKELNKAYLSTGLVEAFEWHLSEGYGDIEFSIYKNIPKLYKKIGFVEELDFIKKAEEKYGVKLLNVPGWHDILRSKWGIHRRACTILNNDSGYWDFLTFHFGEIKETEHLEILAFGEKFAHHLAKATRINRPFELLQSRFNAVFSFLNRFHLGVIIFNHKKQVVLNNDAARLIFDANNGIALNTSQKFILSDVHKEAEFNKCLNQLNDEHASIFSSSMTIPKKNSCIPYYFELSVVNPEEINESNRCFLLIIVDPERNSIVDTDGVKKVFQLTDAEQHVAKLIVDGYSNNEMSEIRVVSSETIKAQVKSIFNKTSCRQRSDLVRLAHKINIPVDKA